MAYTLRGWWVFPLRPRSKEPLTAHGVHDASNESAVVAAWWREWPESNIGLDVHRSGLVVVDLDPARGGVETWETLCAEYGLSAYATQRSRTGSGGLHLLYRAPAGLTLRNSADKLGPGVDVRGKGGYIVLPPSVHPATGKQYSWVEPVAEIDDFPLSFAGLLTPPPAPARSNGHVITDADRTRAYERCIAYLRVMPDAISGSGGHNATFAAACMAYRFGLNDSEAWSALEWFNANKCHPAWSEGELRHKLSSAFDTVSKANEIGVKLLERPAPEPIDVNEVFIPPPETPAPLPVGTTRVADAPTSDKNEKPPLIKDSQLRDRYTRKHQTTVFGLGDWYRYERGIYRRLPESTVAKEVQVIIDEEERRDNRLRPTLWLRKSVLGMVKDVVTVPDEKWNRNPDILVCRNGTLVISRRELRAHSEEDFVTNGVDYDYDPDARSEAWEHYLDTVVPHAKDFLQEFAGLSLTTITDYEISVWLYGPPGGGKSTFLDGMQAMLADRHGLLSLSDIERSQFMLYNLIGRTLVTATENPDNLPIALSKLNAIISGEPITVDIKHKQPIDLRPAVKILWSMNNLPRVTDSNHGIFRRVKVVHVKPIPEAEQDTAVKAQIKASGAALLNWALDGLERLKARGRFDVPEMVKQETAEFKASNDAEQAFVAEECKVYPSAEVKSSVLYEAYRSWCQANGHAAKSSTRVSKEWERLGFKKVHREKGSYWQGVEVRQADLFTG